MKRSRTEVVGKARDALSIRFESQDLTFFSGLIIFQRLFSQLDLKGRLRRCFRPRRGGRIYADHLIVLMLVVHFLLGFRELRDSQYYRDDEMVKRLFGAQAFARGFNDQPDAGGRGRTQRGQSAPDQSAAGPGADRSPGVEADHGGLRRVGAKHGPARRGHGSGIQQKEKGPAQLLSIVLHDRPDRPSVGGAPPPRQCPRRQRRARLYRPVFARHSPYSTDRPVGNTHGQRLFQRAVIQTLDAEGAEFTVSVPFDRFPALKGLAEDRQRWRRRDRFLFIRQRVKRQHKGSLQLDLFVPHEESYEFKVIVTNKSVRAKHVVAFHEGRGAQKGVFAELKSHCHLDYVPVNRLHGNQIYLLAGVMAHNLSRTLQMIAHPRERGTTAKRSPLWAFERLTTLQRKLIQRAGRLLRPGGKPVLSMNANKTVEQELLHYLDAPQTAA